MDARHWNVLLLGSWNPAIFSPKWVARRMFDLPEGTLVDVAVPLMTTNVPFRVAYQKVSVSCPPGQLVLEIEESDAPTLQRALDAARRAMAALPETPVQACGVNLRYFSEDCTSIMSRNMQCATEALLSDAGYEIMSRRRGETIRCDEGELNFVVDLLADGSCQAICNFHRSAPNTSDLVRWLERPATTFLAQAQAILSVVGGLEDDDNAN